jgi:hypothetical protein
MGYARYIFTPSINGTATISVSSASSSYYPCVWLTDNDSLPTIDHFGEPNSYLTLSNAKKKHSITYNVIAGTTYYLYLTNDYG